MRILSLLASLFSIQAYTYVQDVDLSRYDGFWYEVYKDLVDETFQKGGSCVTAQYTLYDNGTVGVYNSELLRNGTNSTIEGVAYYDGNNTGGELTVMLEDLPPAPYWIVDLGPIVDDSYEYSIVSDDKQLTLFVLARDVDRFFKYYDDVVLEYIESMGFTNNYNKPLVVNQTDCYSR